jgi:hypothetical protein
MSVSVRWLDDHTRTAVLLEFDGDWSWNDFHMVVNVCHEMIRSMPHGVDMVVHHKANKEARNPMVHFQKAMRNQPDNLRQVILINENASPVFIRFLQSLAGVMERMRLSKTPTKFAFSLEEARKMVNQRDSAMV